MLDKLRLIQEKIDARILRERALICVSLLALLFMVWDFLVLAPMHKKLVEKETAVKAMQSQQTALQTQLATIQMALLNDPNQQKNQQIQQLQSDVSIADEKLQNASQNIIRADMLPQVMQDVLAKTAQLSLLKVDTLPVTELNTAIAKSSNPSAADANVPVGVYKHPVELTFVGDFAQVLNLLLALESLPWKFYWQSLDYRVAQYPNAKVILRVYSISSEEGLLGV
jgi:MSHA biogenesis protein MshJ